MARNLLEKIEPRHWDSGKPAEGSGFVRVKWLQQLVDLFNRPVLNRLSASTNNTVVNANGTVQSSGVGTGLMQPKRYAEFTVKARVSFNLTGGGNGGGGTPLVLQTNEVNNGSQALLDLHAGANIGLVDNGAGRVTITGAAGGISPAQVPRTGDGLLYNEYGDNNWDAIGALQRFAACFAENGGGNAASAPLIVGCTSTLASVFGGPTLANVPSTATEGYSLKLTSSALAATTVNNGVAVIQGNVGQGHWPFSTFRRFKARVCFHTTANVRWWLGLFEGAQITGASGLNTDTPAFSYAGFRFSAGVDAHIVAVCGQSAILQTVVDTGIVIDTVNSQLFEIAQDATHVYFYINGALVATISTNLPSNTSQFAMAVTGDNKNTANANEFLFQTMILTMR